MSEAGLPKVLQAVQLPAASGANRSSLHTLPWCEGQHAPWPHCLSDLHQVGTIIYYYHQGGYVFGGVLSDPHEAL